MAGLFDNAFSGNWLDQPYQGQDPQNILPDQQSPQLAYDPSVYQQPTQADQPQQNVLQQAQSAQAAPGTYQPQQLGQVPPTQSAPVEPTRQRHTLIDVIGQIGNAFARAGGAPAQYQTQLQQQQARQLEQAKVDAALLDNRAKGQDIAQTSVATTAAANNVIGGFARGLQSLQAAGLDPIKAAPALAQQMGIPVQQAQNLVGLIQQNPANIDALVDATSPVPKTQAGKSLALAFTNATGPDGQPVLLQAAADGTPHVLEGYKPLSDVKVVDRGTTQDIVNGKTGGTIRSLVKSGAPESGTIANPDGTYSALPGSLHTANVNKTVAETKLTDQKTADAKAKAAGGGKADPAGAMKLLDNIESGFNDLHKLGALSGDSGNVVGNLAGAVKRSAVGQYLGAQTGDPAAQKRIEVGKNVSLLQQELIKSLPASATRSRFEQEILKVSLPDPYNMSNATAKTVIAQYRAIFARAMAASKAGQAASTPSSGWGAVSVSQ